MEVRFVGSELNGGDLGEGIVGFQFLDNQLQGGAVVVEAIDGEGLSAKVGDKGPIAVASTVNNFVCRFFYSGKVLRTTTKR